MIKIKMNSYNKSKTIRNYFYTTKQYLYVLFSFLIILAIGLFIFNCLFYNQQWIWEIVRNNMNHLIINYLYFPISLLLLAPSLLLSGISLQASTKNQLAGPTTLGIFPLCVLGLLLAQIMTTTFSYLYIGFGLGLVFSILVLLIHFIIINKYPNKPSVSLVFGFVLATVITSINVLIAINFKQVNISFLQLLGNSSIKVSTNRFILGIVTLSVGLLILVINGSKIKLINQNYDLATGLGARVNLIYWSNAVASSLIGISCCVLVGSVALVAIVMPHFGRLLFKRFNYQTQIWASILATIIFLQFAHSMVSALVKINLIYVTAFIAAIPMIILVKKQMKT